MVVLYVQNVRRLAKDNFMIMYFTRFKNKVAKNIFKSLKKILIKLLFKYYNFSQIFNDANKS